MNKELMKLAAKKKLIKDGVDESEAEVIAESMFKEEEKVDSEEVLGKVAQAGEVMTNLPPEARQSMMPLVSNAILGDMGNEDDIMKDMKKMMQLKMMQMAFKDDNNTNQVIMQLAEQLKDMKEQYLQAEIEKRDEVMQQLVQQMAQMQDNIVNILSQNVTKEEIKENKEFTDKILDDFEQLEKLKELLTKLGFVKEGTEQKEEDLEKYIEKLRKLGFKVENPPTWDVIQRKMEDELKKREEQIRKEVEEELGVKKEKARMAFDFLLSIMDGIMSAASTQGGKKELSNFADVIKKALGGGQGGSSEQAGD